MTDHAIVTERLRKRYGNVVALDGIDLVVEAGTAFGHLGPNGAGKTTAVRILTTIIPPDGGTARVLGRDVTREPEAVRASIGLAGQFAAVDENLTGRENLRMVGRLTQLPTRLVRSRADELLEQFDLVEAASRPVRTYSGGMRRRLDVAAALLGRPPVLFLDEPTTGLDPRSRNELWRVIDELVGAGSTVLLTTQYLEEADRLASRLAVIDQGRVIAAGTPAELKSQLGATAIDVGLADEEAARRAEQLLAGVAAKPPAREGTRLELTVEEGPRVLIEVLRVLDREGLAPTALALREPSLDDVFLAITGQRASGGNDGETRGAA
ncbi:MAG TPA: ATP-binding cassette domain-containing protein [Acidimicrobiales bacterium]|nr:ATP-binding cassette domain-containing protein [Acidimicrobiales bacterium]